MTHEDEKGRLSLIIVEGLSLECLDKMLCLLVTSRNSWIAVDLLQKVIEDIYFTWMTQEVNHSNSCFNI